MCKGQSSFEYAALIFCVVLALLAMRAYMTRGLQGRLRLIADDLGSQYDPRHTNSDFSLRQASNVISASKTETNAQTNIQTTERTSSIIWDREWRDGWEQVENLP